MKVESEKDVKILIEQAEVKLTHLEMRAMDYSFGGQSVPFLNSIVLITSMYEPKNIHPLLRTIIEKAMGNTLEKGAYVFYQSCLN